MLLVALAAVAALVVLAAVVSPLVAGWVEARRPETRTRGYGFPAGAQLDRDGLVSPNLEALADRLSLDHVGAPSAPSG